MIDGIVHLVCIADEGIHFRRFAVLLRRIEHVCLLPAAAHRLFLGIPVVPQRHKLVVRRVVIAGCTAAFRRRIHGFVIRHVGLIRFRQIGVDGVGFRVFVCIVVRIRLCLRGKQTAVTISAQLLIDCNRIRIAAR